MADKIQINGKAHITTSTAAERLGVTTKRILEFIAQGRIEAVYLNGYYIPEAELKKLQARKPGRPTTKNKRQI